jgi:hypothetical protein
MRDNRDMPRTEEALDAILRTLLAQGRTSLEARLPGSGNDSRFSARPLPPLPGWATTAVHRVKVSLHGAKPPVWRRLEVPSDLPLSVLHEVLQTAFGWFDCHPHQFETACGEFGDPAHDDFWSRRGDESTVALAQVAPTVEDMIGYVYDFGDDWRHDIVVEAVLPAAPGVRYPRCTAARGIAPAEDSGGIRAFNSMIPNSAPAPGSANSPAELTRQLTGLAGVVVPAS